MKKILIVGLIFTLVLAGKMSAQEKGLVGYWSFDEGKGEIAKDYSGNNNSGQINNAEWVDGKKGKALKFNGKDAHVEIAVNETLQSVQATTIEAWFYSSPPHQNGFGGIINNINGAANSRLLVRDDGKLLVEKMSREGVFGGENTTKNSWNYIVYVYDGKEDIWYLNGKKIASSPYTKELPSGEMPLTIGWGYTSPESYHFSGIIDEVKIYSRALSEKEIQEHYQQMGGKVSVEPEKKKETPEHYKEAGGKMVEKVSPRKDKTRAGDWIKVVDKAEFSPRDTAEDLVFDGKMWLSNGYYHGNVLYRDLWCSKDGATWTLVSDTTPYDGYSEMVVYDNKMWAVKGSVWTSTDGINWTKVSDKTPFGVKGYGELIVHNDKIWQLGSGSDVWNTTDGINWTCTIKSAPYGRRFASAVTVFKDKLWLMGGSTPETNTPPEKGYPTATTHNDVWCSSDGANWTCVLEHAPWAPRQWFISKVYANKMWIIGGYDNVNAANLGDVWYTEDGINWVELVSETKFSGRHECTCYVYDKSLWVVAGNSWPVMNDVWKLTLP
ncbi:hypothetical protein AUJ66_01150 [Candidatus Desantisbacteria bacterium CG1_02_38_46]|uniref:LamG-like jellyroll fold domain-containing protein n=1 Tax=Candidatus Desantisbacteria bacterium CG1_02_38_46 TaxID=1817893 RepID=A0A1J4SFS7_9BACT|nr:MAG: hypothetical protein AUJ66_01150 [Candidatus Desantisbacteria bacterium CG1_02_38_46]